MPELIGKQIERADGPFRNRLALGIGGADVEHEVVVRAELGQIADVNRAEHLHEPLMLCVVDVLRAQAKHGAGEQHLLDFIDGRAARRLAQIQPDELGGKAFVQRAKRVGHLSVSGQRCHSVGARRSPILRKRSQISAPNAAVTCSPSDFA